MNDYRWASVPDNRVRRGHDRARLFTVLRPGGERVWCAGWQAAADALRPPCPAPRERLPMFPCVIDTPESRP